VIFFGFIPFSGGSALALAPAPVPVKPEDFSSSFLLSDIVQNKNRVGLDFESALVRSAAEQEVEEFLQYRERLSPSRSSPLLVKGQIRTLRDQCRDQYRDAGIVENPFCPLVLNPKFGKLGEIDPALRKEKKKKAKCLVRSVVQGNLNELLRLSATSTEADLNQAFRLVKSSRVMEGLARKILQQDHCASNPLLVALGLRLENEFPAPDFLFLAENLYKKAQSCGKDQSSVAAGYRLGLFQIGSHHCDRAEEVLAQIPESPLASFPIDYRMRIDYWRAVCAEQLQNTQLRDRLTTQIIRQYPLSLHALLLNANLESRQAQLASTLDPPVVLRAKVWGSGSSSGSFDDRRALERTIRDVEVLLLRGEKETARILLKGALPQLLKAEIPFQWYGAVLLQRAGELASSFHLIATIFRQDPRLISKATLQLLYPVVQFDKIQKSAPLGDPFLILSLVRQESAFNVDAKSSVGAQGLMQLEWSTAREFERVSIQQLWDPEVNLRVGVKYLKKLEQRFDGRLDHALAAYNAGPERVKAWLKRYPTPNALLFLDLLPLQETRDYVSAIARNYYWYKQLYAHQGPSTGSVGRADSVGKLSRAGSLPDPEDGEKLLLLLGMRSGQAG